VDLIREDIRWQREAGKDGQIISFIGEDGGQLLLFFWCFFLTS